MDRGCSNNFITMRKVFLRMLLLKTFKDVLGLLSKISFSLALFLVVISSVESVLRLPPHVRYYLYLFLIISVSGHVFFASFVVVKLTGRALRHPRVLIKEIDNDMPDSKILLLYDVYRMLPGSEITEAAFVEICNRSNFFSKNNKTIRFDQILKPVYAYLPLVLYFYLNIFHFGSDSAIYRIYYYNTDFTAPPTHILRNVSVKQNAVYGDSLKLVCAANGEIPESVDLKFRSINRDNFSSVSVFKENDSIFSHTVIALSDFHYFFQTTETSTETLYVNVFMRPEISDLRISVSPPGYTKLPVRVYSGFSNQFFAYKGSSFQYEIRTTLSYPDTVIMYSDDERDLIMTGPDDGAYHSIFTVSDEKKTGFRLVKDHGHLITRNSFSAEHEISIIPDEKPVVNLIYPEKGHILDSSLEIPLFATAGDDFGITEVYVFLRKVQTDLFSGKKKTEYNRIRIKDFDEKDGVVIVNRIVQAGDLNLLPEDKVEIFLRVYDNDAISGPKFSDSDVRTLHLPSIQELLTLSGKNYSEQERVLKHELKTNLSVMEDVKELTKKLKMNRDLTWEDRNRIDNIISAQQEMSGGLESLESEIEKNISLLDQNSLLSRETIEKYSKLQNMIDGLFTNEMKEKIKKLSDLRSSTDFDKEQLSELLGDLENQQKEFQKGLEKSIEILEQIRTEFALDSLIRQIEFLISLQQEINDRLISPGTDLDGVLDDQKRGNSSYADFYEDLESSAVLIDNSNIKAIKESVRKKDIESDYSHALKNIADRSKDRAYLKGSVISGKLYNIKELLDDAKKQILQEQKKEITNDIYRVVDDLLLVSVEIESIKNSSRNLHASSPASAETVTRFARTDDLFNSAAERIFDISKRTFFIDRPIIGSIGRSVEMFKRISDIMINRRFSAAYPLNIQLMGSVNSLIVMLLDAVEEIENSDSPSGIDEMLRKMEEMANKQSQINTRTSDTSMNADMFSPSQMQDIMSRLAMEQYQLYQQLIEIGGEQSMQPGGSDPGDDGVPQPGEGAGVPGPGGYGPSDMQRGNGGRNNGGSQGSGSSLGEKLGDIAGSMKDAGNMLEDRVLDEHLMAKQNEIMQKFIDAIESVRRERTDARREGTAGNKMAVDPGRVEALFETSLKELMIRSLRDGYTSDYRQKIRDYFKELGN